MKNLIYITCVLAIIAIACEKEDYRDKYCGTWHFITYSSERIAHYKDSLYFTTHYDTTEYVGSIKKSGAQKLQIIFQSHETEPVLSDGTYSFDRFGKLYPDIDHDGILSYPELRPSRIYFNGSFIDFDSVTFSYSFESHSFYCKYDITGIKK